MMLLDEIAKLRELERQFSGLVQDANYLYYPDGDEAVRCRGDLGGSTSSGTGLAEMLCGLRNLAPAMLSVLECFQKEDVETLGEILDVFQLDGEPMSWVYADCISRLQKAANLVEQEREG